MYAKSLILSGIASAQIKSNSALLCDGIWGSAGIPFANHDPNIRVKITPYSSHVGLSLAIFSFEDRHYFERDSEVSFDICREQDVKAQKCNETELNQFIIPSSNSLSGPILNQAVHYHSSGKPLEKRQDSSPEASTTTTASEATATPTDYGLEFTYNVGRTGSYCVLAIPDDKPQDYKVQMIIQNPYGALPAIFYPAIPFFATSLAAYIIIGLIWFVSSYVHGELLRIQNLIGVFIIFLIFENIINLSFFADFNNHGYISKGFLAVMVALNAGRNSLSFFILLVVCLGYGVVYPSLGQKMYSCIILTVIHFVFGALYFTTSMVSKDVNSFLVFLLGLPLALTLFVFYFSILLGLASTITYLESKRQSVKLLMYKKLNKILSGSVVVLFIIFFLNGLNMMFRHTEYSTANQFKWRWLLLDGALNANYFFAFILVGWQWIPSQNNRRLSLEQLGTEDDMDDITENNYEDMELDKFGGIENNVEMHVPSWDTQIQLAEETTDFIAISPDRVEDLQ